VWQDGKAVGWITSGDYGHSVGKSLALGYIPKELAGVSTGFEIEILGERCAATKLDAPAFDPTASRMRG
jgi:dimethylglycine dehydrogenase